MTEESAVALLTELGGGRADRALAALAARGHGGGAGPSADRALGVLTLVNRDGARPAGQDLMALLPMPDADPAEIASVLAVPDRQEARRGGRTTSY